MSIGIIEGAIIGGIVGGVVVLVQASAKQKRYTTVMKSITGTVDYSALYHYAAATRYNKSYKFYDSYGVLYLIGNKVYYKTSVTDTPMEFDMSVCTIQQEPDWRWLKWFSITKPSGEKYYFDSNKTGGLKNNSDETLKGFAAIKARTTTA